MPFFRAPVSEAAAFSVHLVNPVFIADLHLSKEAPALTRAFLAFLKAFDTAGELKGKKELVILGDLFDAWLGDDTSADLAEVRDALRRFSTGRRLYLMQGNRDFLIGARFAREVGAMLLADPVIATIGAAETRALLSHGDRWCTSDLRYQTVRARLRRPFIQLALLNLPLWVRRRVAADAKNRSRAAKSAHTRKGDWEVLDVTPAAVLADAKHFGSSLVIHGHTHRPAIHPLSTTPTVFSGDERASAGTRIVLSDWLCDDGKLTKGDALTFTDTTPVKISLTHLLDG